MAKLQVALQMYTLRNEAQEDFLGTFRQVAEMGYRGVELAGTGGLGAVELRHALSDMGLAVAGNHVSLDQLENNLEAALEYNTALGNVFVVCPWLPEDRRQDADGYKRLAATLNDVGQQCRERGLQLCYHNHNFEFQRFEGKTGFDILFQDAFPDLVKAELDTYWVEFAGENAVQYIEHYAGRIPLVHLKDMTGGENRTFAELGQGTLDWDAVIAACERASVDWYIVEQDTCQRPPLESVRISLEYLCEKGWA